MAHEDPIRWRTQQSIPTVRELAMVLFRQRRVFVWMAIVVFAAGVLYALVGTKYEAKMKILVRRGRADAPVSSGVNAPLDLTHLAMTQEELNCRKSIWQSSAMSRKRVNLNDWPLNYALRM